MEQTVIFEEKVSLSPKDMNRMAKETIDQVLLSHLQTKMENRCSHHGFVIPGTISLLSRSMGHLENGRYTGNVVFHVQAEGRTYNPSNGTRITGSILKKNKMGLYVMYKDAIRILVPRDLHLGNEEFESLEVDDVIEIEIRKSRFQIHDAFILSVGVFVKRISAGAQPEPAAALAPVAAEADAESETEEEAESDEDLGQIPDLGTNEEVAVA